MGGLTAESVAFGLTTYVVLLFSLSVHESAHAWTALRMGDRTAESQGRITLNPLAHIDPIGTVLIPLLQIFWGGFLIGWAKPVPVDPRGFRDMRKGEIVVSGAGPASNALLAVIFTALLFIVVRLGLVSSGHSPLFMLLAMGVQLNVLLALFNLVPLPPLDGSHMAKWGLPPQLAEGYRRIVEPYGMLILIALFATGLLGRLLGPVLSVVTAFLFNLAL